MYSSKLFSILENELIDYADDPTLFSVVASQGVRVTVTESLNREPGKVSEQCAFWWMKLKASKTMTLIVSWSSPVTPTNYW